MRENILKRFSRDTKNFVFIGGTGAGKTEAALSFAAALAEIRGGQIHFFDMDQTKPLFRARDCGQMLEKHKIHIHAQLQFLDAPVIAPAVIECLTNPERLVVMDVGGGEQGGHMIGQFSEYLLEKTEVLYLINPYRPWSGSLESIEKNMESIFCSTGLRAGSFIANPNLGTETDVDTVMHGVALLREILPGISFPFICAPAKICGEVAEKSALPVLPIYRHMGFEQLTKEMFL